MLNAALRVAATAVEGADMRTQRVAYLSRKHRIIDVGVESLLRKHVLLHGPDQYPLIRTVGLKDTICS